MVGGSGTEASYTLTVDDERRLLIINATGFWDHILQTQFGDDLLLRMRALRDAGRLVGVLADVRRFPVQSVSVSMGFMDIVKRLDKDLLVPTAVVSTSMLVKLQAIHVFVAPHIRMFGDVDAAQAWLSESAG